MIVLGIDSSCDETAAALVRDGRECLSSVVASGSRRVLPRQRTRKMPRSSSGVRKSTPAPDVAVFEPTLPMLG